MFFPMVVVTALFLACGQQQVCVSASFQGPCSPPASPLTVLCPYLLCSFPVPSCSTSASLLASLPHSPTFCLPPAPPPLSVLPPASHLGPSPGIWALETDRCPAVPRCPSALRLWQEGWAKGRGWRPPWPNLELRPRSGWERKEETRNLGTEGVGVAEWAKAAREL